MRSIVGRLRSPAFGRDGAVSEIPIFHLLVSNLARKTRWRQCLAGSLSGADSSKRVTEEFIKVHLARMEIGQDAEKHKKTDAAHTDRDQDNGPRLEPQSYQAGISRLTPSELAPGLQSLPAILHRQLQSSV